MNKNINELEYGNIFIAALTDLKKIFSGKGRESIQEVNRAVSGIVTVSAIIAFVICLVCLLANPETPTAVLLFSPLFGLGFGFILYLFFIFPATLVRLFHDKGKSGLWTLILWPVALVTIPIGIIATFCYFTSERDEDNQYGPADRNQALLQ